MSIPIVGRPLAIGPETCNTTFAAVFNVGPHGCVTGQQISCNSGCKGTSKRHSHVPLRVTRLLQLALDRASQSWNASSLTAPQALRAGNEESQQKRAAFGGYMRLSSMELEMLSQVRALAWMWIWAMEYGTMDYQ